MTLVTKMTKKATNLTDNDGSEGEGNNERNHCFANDGKTEELTIPLKSMPGESLLLGAVLLLFPLASDTGAVEVQHDVGHDQGEDDDRPVGKETRLGGHPHVDCRGIGRGGRVQRHVEVHPHNQHDGDVDI